MRTKLRLLQGCLLLAILVLFTGCPPPHCEGPDPRAMEIRYSLISSSSPFTGTVRIAGVVSNWGLSPFESSQGQQSVLLYEGDELVGQQDFSELPVNGAVEVTYERTWNIAEEFRQTSYTVIVDYDPDIFIDGNPNNDDCNLADNDLTRSSAGLDALFEP